MTSPFNPCRPRWSASTGQEDEDEEDEEADPVVDKEADDSEMEEDMIDDVQFGGDGTH